MALYKRGKQYWTAFSINKVAYRKPLNTSNRSKALELQREMIQLADEGRVSAKKTGPRDLDEAIKAYFEDKRIRVSARTIDLENERLSIVKKHFENPKLEAITAASISAFQKARHELKISNRTINLDVAVLSRVLKHCKHWRRLKDDVHFLPERPSLIGKALTAEERQRLLKVAASNPEWEHLYCASVLALSTTMRRGEVTHLRRRDVDLFKKTVSISRSKNDYGCRIIPLTNTAVKVLASMLARADKLGFADPNHYLWFACQWNRLDPAQPIRQWDTAWRAIRDEAALPGLRFHDLRHTAISELAERGTPDSVLKAIAGHLTQRMLDYYSHIRLLAKRQALENLETFREGEVRALLESVVDGGESGEGTVVDAQDVQ